MSLLNLVKHSTATTGTGTITLGAAVSGFLTITQAGGVNGTTYSYGIKDGANSEVGTGVWSSAGGTLTRTVIKSTNSNAAISLSGSATVYITALAEDFAALAPLASPAFTNGGTVDLTGGYLFSVTASSTAGKVNLSGGGDGITPTLNVRPEPTQKGVVLFTHNTVADRWSIGIKGSDASLYFSPDATLSSPKLTLTSTALTLASGVGLATAAINPLGGTATLGLSSDTTVQNSLTIYGGTLALKPASATTQEAIRFYRSGTEYMSLYDNFGYTLWSSTTAYPLQITNMTLVAQNGVMAGAYSAGSSISGASLQIYKGSTTVAPIRLDTTGAAILTSPLSGVIETDGTDLYWTTSGASRYALLNTNTGAPKASPVFTGTPSGPTPTADTNNTQFATTAFVHASEEAVIVPVTGGTLTLTTAQAAVEIIVLTGTLTSNLTVNFGNSTASYYNRTYTVYNLTTGSFSVTLSPCATSPSTTLPVIQNTSIGIITYTNIINQFSDTANADTFTSTLKGVVPASGGGTSNFLRADGTWVAPPTGTGSTSKGQVVVDFGTSGATNASVTVTGQSSILATSSVMVEISIAASTDHTADEHLVEEIFVFAGNIVAGTGFTIYARADNFPLYGKWNVSWMWT